MFFSTKGLVTSSKKTDARLLGLEIVSKTEDTERMLATAGAAVASKVHRVLEKVKRSTNASDTTAASASKAAEEVSRHVTQTEAILTTHSCFKLTILSNIFLETFVIACTLPFSRRLVRNSSARTRLGKNEITSAMKRAHCPTLHREFSSYKYTTDVCACSMLCNELRREVYTTFGTRFVWPWLHHAALPPPYHTR